MPRLSVEEGIRVWREAETFAQLCELTAQFVTGASPFYPGWCSETLDDESAPLLEYLAAFNRAGFLTVNSQPGEPFRPGFDGHCWAQRAYVCGFAPEPVAARIEALALCTDLLVTVHRPGEGGGYRVPCVVRGQRPCLWVGDALFEVLDHFADYCGKKALETLRSICSVNVIDLCWGRHEHLWSTLAQELCPPWDPASED
jgi:hypothetical protein